MSDEPRKRRRPFRLPIALAPEERKTLDEVAREHVLRVLDACGGRLADAARVLGVNRKTIYRQLRSWGISRPRRGPTG